MLSSVLFPADKLVEEREEEFFERSLAGALELAGSKFLWIKTLRVEVMGMGIEVLIGVVPELKLDDRGFLRRDVPGVVGRAIFSLADEEGVLIPVSENRDDPLDRL